MTSTSNDGRVARGMSAAVVPAPFERWWRSGCSASLRRSRYCRCSTTLQKGVRHLAGAGHRPRHRRRDLRFGELAQPEVSRIVAAYVMGNRNGLVKGTTYEIVSEIGNDD